MANPTDNLATYLGRNITALRELRNLSQVQLARLSGIPRSTLAHMESGFGNPSLQALAKLSGSLQVSLEELVSRPRVSCQLIRSRDIPRQKRGPATVLKLLPDAIPGMEIDRMELEKGARMGGVPHVANTKEYLVCIEGAIQVFVAGQKYELAAGDVFAFPGDQPHSYLNVGKTRSVSLSVVALAPPGV